MPKKYNAAKECQWRGKTFPSKKARAEYLGYHRSHIDKQLKEGIDIDTIERNKKGTIYQRVSRAQECQWRDKTFPSKKARADYLGYNVGSIREHEVNGVNIDVLERKKKKSDVLYKWRDKTFPTQKARGEYLGYHASTIQKKIDAGVDINTIERKDWCSKFNNVTPITWRGIEFESIKEFHREFDIASTKISAIVKKFGNVDHIIPRKTSGYYSEELDPTVGECFVKEAVEYFGVKAVAKAYRKWSSEIRLMRKHGTLWTLRVPRYKCHEKKVMYKTKEELFSEIIDPPRRPYVYMFHWTKTNMRYVGSRTGEYCEPAECGKTYFSSSRKVAEYIKKHGKPDKIYTIEYDTVTNALFAEGFMLMLISGAPKFKKHYMNQVLWIPNMKDPWLCRGTRNEFIVKCGDGALKRKRQLLELLLRD